MAMGVARVTSIFRSDDTRTRVVAGRRLDEARAPFKMNCAAATRRQIAHKQRENEPEINHRLWELAARSLLRSPAFWGLGGARVGRSLRDNRKPTGRPNRQTVSERARLLRARGRPLLVSWALLMNE